MISPKVMIAGVRNFLIFMFRYTLISMLLGLGCCYAQTSTIVPPPPPCGSAARPLYFNSQWYCVPVATNSSSFVYTGLLSGIPATCSVGQLAFITNATPGQNQYNCTATNTWTQNLNSGTGAAFSLMTGGTVTGTAAAPIFSLAAVSTKSPTIFNFTMSASVTSPTITNLSAGAFVQLNITSDGNSAHTWSWNSIITKGQACAIYTDAVATTTALIWVDGDGTDIWGMGCLGGPVGALAAGPIVAAPSATPSSGNIQCNGPTVNGITCETSSGAVLIMLPFLKGQVALATSAIASGACQTVTPGSINSVAVANITTAASYGWSFSGSVKAIIGYVPGTTGGLSVSGYVAAGYLNWDVCNWTSGSITPGAVTVNWWDASL